jgi:hypothetical protein
MIAFDRVKVWITGGVADMRCGMNSRALKVQQGLGRDPHYQSARNVTNPKRHTTLGYLSPNDFETKVGLA